MLCRAAICEPTDVPFWISRAKFDEIVHPHDYLCRDAQFPYLGAYLVDWFKPADDGSSSRFCLPVVHEWKGRLKFINGRHRTAVLRAHIDPLPLAFALRDDESGTGFALFTTARAANLMRDQLIELPDLPILPLDELRPLADWTKPRVPTPGALGD